MFEIPKLGDEDSQYDGSRTFTWLAEICGLSVDIVSNKYHNAYHISEENKNLYEN